MVSPGETIYRISTKYKVPISDLIELNPELEGGLKVGQIISIPYNPALALKEEKENTISIANNDDNNTSTTENNSSKSNIHIVQAGETLYGLSKKYGVSVEELKKWNNFDLKVGQQIVISNPNNSFSPAPKTIVKSEETSTTQKPTNNTNTTTPKIDNNPLAKNSLSTEKTTPITSPTPYPYDPSMKQVLIIPFDPYLYFSDADDEIAAASNMHRTKIRQVFRRRMNALLDHPGYENIHLLGGKAHDSISDLNKIYSSVTYNYQESLYNPNYVAPQASSEKQGTGTQQSKTWLQKQKEKITTDESSKKAITSKDNGKYFGVLIKNPEFFNYFNQKYNTDYYVFINQFEIKTNYENCLDRAAHNFDRTFTTHFSIFDSKGKQIAGNKFKLNYNSNSNNVNQIATENMLKIADRIIAELPTPEK
jgi:LysM repeat protein